MADQRSKRPVPPWIVPLLLVALLVLTGATGGNEGGGSAGGDAPWGTILLLLAGAIVGAATVLVVGYLVLRWRAGPTPVEAPGEWWSCPACGAANIVGSPRCYACGAWPR